jgi:hypothetical protein
VQGLAFPELADSGLFGPRDEGSYYIELAILFGAFIPVNIIILSAVLCLYYPLMAASRRERHETFESPHIHAVACALFAGAIVALSAGGDPLSVAAFAVPLALCTWVAAILMGFFIRDGLRLTYALLGHDTGKSAG